MARQRANQRHDAAPHQRLAAGQPQLAHAAWRRRPSTAGRVLPSVKQIGLGQEASCPPPCSRRSGSRSGPSPRRADSVIVRANGSVIGRDSMRRRHEGPLIQRVPCGRGSRDRQRGPRFIAMCTQSRCAAYNPLPVQCKRSPAGAAGGRSPRRVKGDAAAAAAVLAFRPHRFRAALGGGPAGRVPPPPDWDRLVEAGSRNRRGCG